MDRTHVLLISVAPALVLAPRNSPEYIKGKVRMADTVSHTLLPIPIEFSLQCYKETVGNM